MSKSHKIHRIGQNSLADVSRRQDQKQRGKSGPLQRIHTQPKQQIANQKQRAGEQLNRWIERRNLRLAVPAFSAKDQPTQHRNIVVGRNRLLTFCAVRSRQDNGFTRRNPQDADVQEAADKDTDQEYTNPYHSLTVPQEGTGLNVADRW